MKKIHLVGAGLIGLERLKAIKKLQERGHTVETGYIFDPYNSRLAEISKEYGGAIAPNLETLLDTPSDLVVIACPHDIATETACAALRKGHLVLIEKPLGRNLGETKQIAEASSSNQLFVGLNYRFMPGIAHLVDDWKKRRFGQPISLRLQIGHGGKPGDEKTWKLDPVRCGGGALLDPGIHLLDLATLMLEGEPEIKAVNAYRGFWKTGIEEDVHVILAHSQHTVSIETSIVKWRSHFEITALGTDGYGVVSGRGRSYGEQTYRRGIRWGWQKAANQAASEELVVTSNCEDSFADELANCLNLEQHPSARPASLSDGLAMMSLYHQLRQQLS